MRLYPKNDFIFVSPIIEERKDFILPPVFQKKVQNAQRGRVIASGDRSPVKEGEIILFDKWADNAITLNDQELLMIKPAQILAVENTHSL